MYFPVDPRALFLSAITWADFANFYKHYGYEDTPDAFNILHDLKILADVFGVENGDYRRRNGFWTSYDLIALAGSENRDTF